MNENLTRIQRIAITEKYRPIFKKTEENLKQSGEIFGKGLKKSSNPIEQVHTRVIYILNKTSSPIQYVLLVVNKKLLSIF